MTPPAEPRRHTGRHYGQRRRRLRRVALLLGVVTAGSAAAGIWAYRSSRADLRRPGEELPEITRKLARHLPAEAPVPRFADVTAAAGLAGFRSFAGHRSSQLPEDMGPGAAWGDFDDDGDDDLFLVSGGGALDLPAAQRAPCALYENLGDGSFQRSERFPETRVLGMGAAWGDYDGDSRLDLALSGYDTLLLFRNDGARFVHDPAIPELAGFWAGVVWADVDNDRDLDLYVAGYVRYVPKDRSPGQLSDQYGSSVPYTLNPASYAPERNLLFVNQGDGSFVEAAEAMGAANPEGRSLGALWHDFDDDGRLDLYVANDISDNALFHNRPDGFADVGLAAWVADYRGAMGLAAGDWNRDGDDDLFITHWVAQENALYDSLLQDSRSAAGAAAPAAGLGFGFTDVAAPRGLGQIALPLVGWGTEFLDFDSDGWLDLVVANGSTFETDTEPRALKPQATLLLWNQQAQYFHDLAPLSPDLVTPHVGRGLAVADYDNDGDQDVLIVHHGGGAQLLRNDVEQGGWLKVRLRSRGASGEPGGRGEGSTVIAAVDGVELRRSVTGASYLSQSSPVLHFGLGPARRVERLEVRWLGGGVDRHGGLEAAATYEIVEGEPTARRLEAAEGAAALDDGARLVAFWVKQRAAMDALKRDGDCHAATPLFREALVLDPAHQDARYYLAQCLAWAGETGAALAELDTLRRRHPESHRAHRQWGVVRAMSASSPDELAAAVEALEAAHALNPEETGGLLVLGELALLQGKPELAAQHLELACRSNPRAVGGFFLRAYVAWKQARTAASVELLGQARAARGEDFKPEGSVAEGEVARRMHREMSPLAEVWQHWDGGLEPEHAFAPLEVFLAARQALR